MTIALESVGRIKSIQLLFKMVCNASNYGCHVSGACYRSDTVLGAVYILLLIFKMSL